MTYMPFKLLSTVTVIFTLTVGFITSRFPRALITVRSVSHYIISKTQFRHLTLPWPTRFSPQILPVRASE